jgi:pyruvate kinase
MLTKDLLKKWTELKQLEKETQERRHQVEADIYVAVQSELPKTGSSTFNCDDMKVKITQNFTVKVDQEKAKERPDLFKVKYEMSFSQYEKSPEKLTLDDYVVITSGKPSFVVE